MNSSASYLSIAIITLNEEHNLPRCLASLPAGAEIVVVDSGSTDNTVAIARQAGARVVERAFAGFADQKNAAIAEATRPWVLSIDADEVMDVSLREAIIRVCAEVPTESDRRGYRVRRRLHFMGRRLRFGKTTDWPTRLFPRVGTRFHGEIHEEARVEGGRVERLSRGCLDHFSYRDLTDYFTRFNRYTSMIAAKHVAQGDKGGGIRHWARPWTEFGTRYILRLGFLDGYAGYTYALCSALYAFVKYAKTRDVRMGERR